MKMSLDNTPFLDRSNGQPVEGRIRIYEHGTDVYKTLYTAEGDQYVTAANPQLIHGGYPDSSLFADLGIVDIHLDKYIGAEGQMSVESPDEDFEQIDVFEFGLDYDIEQATANIVKDLGELRNTNPELGLVTVTWYAEEGDCFPRQYIWDALCQNEEDGGYVVRSDVSDTGRWVLLWGDEVLPCTVYGVRPGDESNMNLLLNYQTTVGSFALKTAPCVRFITGSYTENVNYATSKELCFDKGAQFVNSVIQCNSIRLFDKPTSYIADFIFTCPEMEAHSSWFKSIDRFLTCGAKTLVVDGTDNFVNKTLKFPTTVAGSTRIYAANTRLPITYVNNGRLTLSRVNIVGNGVFNQTDKLSFAYMEIHDDWWLTPNTIDWSSTVFARSTSLNTLLLANFKSVDAYIAAVKANGETILDLAGRRVTNVSIGVDSITELRNVQCTNLNISRNGGDIVLRDVHADNVLVSCRYLTTHDNCDLNFTSEPNLMACWFYDSRINASTPWYTSKQVIAENCWIGIVFNFASDNEADHASLDFTECRFQTNVAFYVKRISMKRCVTSNNTIKIYPYKNTEGYHLVGNFENNVFNNNTPIEFTKFDILDGRYQDDVYDCIANWAFIGNTFAGNDEGIRCRYWQNRTGNNYSKTFIKIGQGVNTIVYEGNNGKCPAASMRGIVISSTDSYTEQSLDEDHSVYKYPSAWRRVMPGISTSEWWSQHTYDNTETLIKWYSWVNSPYDSLTYDVFYQTAWFSYFRSHDDPINNGDFFAMAILTFGDWIRIVQRGDGDHNRGIVAKVV